MQMRLLELLRLIAVARQAGVHRIGLNEARRLAGMRVMADSAIALRARMRHFRFLDLCGLLAMAGHAQRLHIRLRQDHLAIFRRLMAGLARSHCKWRMGERLHQVG